MNRPSENLSPISLERHGLDVVWAPETQNKIFRILMEAMSRPGTRQSLEATLKPSSCNGVTALLATLTDAQVTACDLDSLVREADWLMAQCKASNSDVADYIIADGSLPCAIDPKLGTLSCPDESATVILRVDSLDTGTEYSAFGPGVDGSIVMSIEGLDESWLSSRSSWVANFPLGVDFFLVSALSVMALPRTIRLERAGQLEISG